MNELWLSEGRRGIDYGVGECADLVVIYQLSTSYAILMFSNGNRVPLLRAPSSAYLLV